MRGRWERLSSEFGRKVDCYVDLRRRELAAEHGQSQDSGGIRVVREDPGVGRLPDAMGDPRRVLLDGSALLERLDHAVVIELTAEVAVAGGVGEHLDDDGGSW